MRELNMVFGRAFEDPDAYEAAPPPDQWLIHQLSSDAVVALVAVHQGAVIGGLVAYELPKLEQARRELYIYDLAVDAAHRRQGVATALIDHLRHHAADRQAWVIYVQADHGDEPAIALYTKLGRRKDVMHFDIAPALQGRTTSHPTRASG
jgi:aminoglycoside 3-N-acetyltransferase I